MEKFLRRPYLPGICEGAEVPHQCGPVGRKGMEELLKFFLDLQSASLHSGLSSFCPYSYAIPCAHMQIEETVTSRVGAYGAGPRHPMLSPSFDDWGKPQRRQPHLYAGVLRRPGFFPGRLHQHSDQGVTAHPPSPYPSWSTAPAGITPVSRKRQSAMSNLRATATIPIRRKRVPPPPKRSRNQTLRALAGCKRSQLQANSVVIQRTCRLPDLVIPCSRALSPL